MDQRWTLQVRNFGPIQSADIEIHPFMMFIGPNNSGKSYLSTLLWGLMTHNDLLFDKSIIECGSYNSCLDFVEQELNKNNNKYRFNITKSISRSFIALYNEIIDIKKNELVKKIFNDDTINIDELRIVNYQQSHDYTIVIDYSLKNPVKSSDWYWMHVQAMASRILFNEISGLFRKFNLFGGINQSLIFPSARTGFMLNYRALASSTIRQGFSLQERPKGLHTAPTIHFLQGLIEMPENELTSQYQDIITWLENEVIKGTFSRKDDLLPNFYYVPEKLQQPLPFHITSSLVTELSPLSLFLKNHSEFGSLFIEEPEAHLHPAAQRKMAQALVKLVNRGLPVWITTHSDIMFQQFNNLIALSYLPNRAETLKEMGYDESDVLDPDKAIAYEFVIEEGGTVVKPLDLMNTGFAAPSFNQTLGDLMAETIKLHDLLDNAEADAS